MFSRPRPGSKTGLPIVITADLAAAAVAEPAAVEEQAGPLPVELYGFAQFDTVDDFSDHKFAPRMEPAQNPR